MWNQVPSKVQNLCYLKHAKEKIDITYALVFVNIKIIFGYHGMKVPFVNACYFEWVLYLTYKSPSLWSPALYLSLFSFLKKDRRFSDQTSPTWKILKFPNFSLCESSIPQTLLLLFHLILTPSVPLSNWMIIGGAASISLLFL